MPPIEIATLPTDLPRSISREALNELPIRRYEGEIVLVTSIAELERARDDLAAERVVGFDTETRPAFRKGESFLPCLAQVATARAVYLFRLGPRDAPAEVLAASANTLAKMLGASGPVKAGVSLADDVKALAGVFPFEAERLLDLGRLARQHGLAQSGVRNLAAIFLGARIPKGSKTSNWAAARLNSQQIGYAATDAWICREIYLHFERLGLIER